jgi:hypothetical protein
MTRRKPPLMYAQKISPAPPRRFSGRAEVVLMLMREPDRVLNYGQGLKGRCFTEDGEWFLLWRIPNIGKQTIAELLSAHAIEPHELQHLIGFRLPPHDDFGDLWLG